MSGSEGVLVNIKNKIFASIFDSVSKLVIDFVKICILLMLTFWLALGFIQWWEQSVIPCIIKISEKFSTEKISEDQLISEPSTSHGLRLMRGGSQTNFQGPEIRNIYENIKHRLSSLKHTESSKYMPPNCPAQSSTHKNKESQNNCEEPDIKAIYEDLMKRQHLMEAKSIETSPVAVPMSSSFTQKPRSSAGKSDLEDEKAAQLNHSTNRLPHSQYLSSKTTQTKYKSYNCKKKECKLHTISIYNNNKLNYK